MIRVLILCLLAFSAFAETLDGYVIKIADGDTLTVLDAANQQHKIRLAGIDAPEKAQPFGDRSKTNLARLVFNKNVQIEWKKRDRYDRIIGKVLINGTDVCLEQVKSGMAWWYRDYAREQSVEDHGNYEHAELMAKLGRVGLWSDKNPIPPWEWRRESRD